MTKDGRQRLVSFVSPLSPSFSLLFFLLFCLLIFLPSSPSPGWQVVPSGSKRHPQTWQRVRPRLSQLLWEWSWGWGIGCCSSISHNLQWDFWGAHLFPVLISFFLLYLDYMFSPLYSFLFIYLFLSCFSSSPSFSQPIEPSEPCRSRPFYQHFWR